MTVLIRRWHQFVISKILKCCPRIAFFYWEHIPIKKLSFGVQKCHNRTPCRLDEKQVSCTSVLFYLPYPCQIITKGRKIQILHLALSPLHLWLDGIFSFHSEARSYLLLLSASFLPSLFLALVGCCCCRSPSLESCRISSFCLFAFECRFRRYAFG